MKKVYISAVVLLLISCGVEVKKEEPFAEQTNRSASQEVESPHAGHQSLFTKEDLKGAWTSGETENASFSIEEDSILFVDALEFVKYKFSNDSILYLQEGIPYHAAKVLKADQDSLVISDQEGVQRFWRFKE